MQTAFCSLPVTTLNILRSSSGLASAGTYLLLCSLFLVNVCLGFCDTIVSCFSSYLPHTSAECPPLLSPSVLSYVCSLPQQSPLLPGDDPEGREPIFCPYTQQCIWTALSLEPQTRFSNLWRHHTQQTGLSPSGSPFRSWPCHPLCHQARNLGLILDFFSLSFCFIWLI